MKDQYFGDVKDYFKYAIIRRLTRSNGVRTAVCWMLTERVEGKEGHKTNYLSERQAGGWCPIDPPLFDCLREAVCARGERRVSVIEKSGLLHDTSFYREPLPGTAIERKEYFGEFLRRARGRELVFFDADTGLNPPSKTYGQRPSRAHLFSHEVAAAFNGHHSLLIFQDRPRFEYIEIAVQRLATTVFRNVIGAYRVDVFHTRQVSFALVPHPIHSGRFPKQVAGIKQEDWPGSFCTRSFVRNAGGIHREA